jgi:hypothetical protein
MSPRLSGGRCSIPYEVSGEGRADRAHDRRRRQCESGNREYHGVGGEEADNVAREANVKRAGIWFVAILALFAAIISGLFIFHPTARLVMSVLIAPLLNNSGPPPIAQGVITKEDRLHFQAAGKKFTETLQSRFPIGSREDVLKSILLGQGFRSAKSPPPNCIPLGQPVPVGVVFYRCPTPQEEEQRKRTLVYEWTNGICGQTLFVIWSSNELGALTDVRGHYSGACL